jgi:hypothetical protein
MPQIKTNRRQDKFFKKVKIVSLTFCFLLILASGVIIYQNFIQSKPLFLSPLSNKAHTQIETYLKNKNIKYQHLEEYPNYYVLQLQTGESVIVSKNKDIAEQLSSLQLIQSRLKIEGKEFKSLDMRFAQPVIK